MKSESGTLEWKWVEPTNKPGYSPTIGFWHMEAEQGDLWYSASVMPAQTTLPFIHEDGKVRDNIHRIHQTETTADLWVQWSDDNHSGVTLFSLPKGADPEMAKVELERRLRAVLLALAEEPSNAHLP